MSNLNAHDEVGASVQSTSASTSRGPHREIDIEAGGDPPEAMPNEVGSSSSSRPWRLDFDLNFDPSWLVSRNGPGVRQLQGPLSMLNDWVRNSIPGGSQTASTAATTTSVTSDPRRTSVASVAGGASASGTVAEPAPLLASGGSRLGGRRLTPPHQTHVHHHRRSSAAPEDDHEDVDNENANSDSQAFIVDMGGSGNGSGWNNNSPDESRVVPGTGTGSGREPSTPVESPTSETAPSEILRLRQSPEARALIQIIERYTPFVLILFIKGIFDHGSGILCFLALLITFSHANSLFKKEVAKQGKRNIFYVAMIIVNLLICISFMYYVFDDQKLYPALGFMYTNLEIDNIWTLLWVVGVTDYIAKFVTIIAKCVFLALPEAITPFQKRGKFYLFVEQTSQLYRSLLPLHPYFIFLFDSYDGTLQVFGFILTGIYILFKLGDILQRLKAWRVAFRKLLQQSHYGSPPTEEQLANVGQACPICHDTFTHPTRLSCTHIFCEECVSTWFDRERTCPMCRAKVVDDPAYRDGSTTHFIQLF